MRRVVLLVIFATCAAACDRAEPSTGKAEPKVVQTEVIDPTSVPAPPPPAAHKPLLTDPPAAPPHVVATPSTDAADAPDAPAPKVKAKAGALELLSAGDEPRYTLRYQATEGAHETLVMATSMRMSMPPQDAIVFPKMIVEASIAASKVASDGKTSLDITLTSTDVEDVPGSKIPADQVKAQMGDVVGMKTTIVLDEHGHLTDEHGGPIQQVEQSQMGFNQLAAPLPTEPIGKGAKWRIKQKVDQGELEVDQVLTYEVVEITATTATLRATGKMTAPRQTIDWQGNKVDLQRTTGSSDATLTIDFTHLVPGVRGTVEMTMTMKAADGETATMTTKSVMSMHAK